MIADAIDVICQAHTLSNVVAKAPEVDDVAAGTQLRRALDQHWPKPAFAEPISQGWACNADARNQDRFVCHWAREYRLTR